MKITYSLNGRYLWEVEEGSMMDKVLQDIEKRARAKNTLAIIRAWKSPYIVTSLYSQRKEHKDLLLDVERA